MNSTKWVSLFWQSVFFNILYTICLFWYIGLISNALWPGPLKFLGNQTSVTFGFFNCACTWAWGNELRESKKQLLRKTIEANDYKERLEQQLRQCTCRYGCLGPPPRSRGGCPSGVMYRWKSCGNLAAWRPFVAAASFYVCIVFQGSYRFHCTSTVFVMHPCCGQVLWSEGAIATRKAKRKYINGKDQVIETRLSK